MERDCKTLNLDECRTRADCGTRKKPKSDDLMCFKKAVRAPKQDVPPPLVRKAAVAPKAPRMTAAHKAELRDDRPKLAFGKNGSLCAGMTETDCGKAKTACNWVKESKDGTKAYCGMRTHGTKYEGMPELSKFNAFNFKKYKDDEKADEPKIELSENAKRAARWGQAYNSSNANVAAARAARKGITNICAGMTEVVCKKPSVQVACKWTKASADGKKKAYCSTRTDSNLTSTETAKEMAKKFAELNKKKVAYGENVVHGGESDPVLRLFYGY